MQLHHLQSTNVDSASERNIPGMTGEPFPRSSKGTSPRDLSRNPSRITKSGAPLVTGRLQANAIPLARDGHIK